MKTEMALTGLMSGKVILANLLVLVAVAWVIFTVNGKQLSWLSNGRVNFIILVVLGMVACTVGMYINARPQINWLHPLTITSSVIGMVGLVVLVFGMIGKPIPFIPGQHSALYAMTAVILLKWAVTWLHTLIG